MALTLLEGQSAQHEHAVPCSQLDSHGPYAADRLLDAANGLKADAVEPGRSVGDGNHSSPWNGHGGRGRNRFVGIFDSTARKQRERLVGELEVVEDVA